MEGGGWLLKRGLLPFVDGRALGRISNSRSSAEVPLGAGRNGRAPQPHEAHGQLIRFIRRGTRMGNDTLTVHQSGQAPFQ